MIKHRALWGAALVLGTLVLSGCGSASTPSAQASTAAATAASTPAASSTPTVGSNAGGDFCTAVKQARSDMEQMATNVAKSVAAGSFAASQQTLSAFMQAVLGELAKIESTMTNAPANVQAALTVVNQFYAQATSVVTHSTSTMQMGLGIAALSKSTKGLKAAGNTITAWGVSQCGSLSTP